MSRSDLDFWRLLAVILAIVCTVNIMVLLNRNNEPTVAKHKSVFPPIPDDGEEEDPTRSYYKHPFDVIFCAESSEIWQNSKLEVWPSVDQMDEYINGENVLVLGKKRKSKGHLVLGVPTVFRKEAYHVVNTVKSLVTNLEPDEKPQVVIVIFIADFDTTYREKVVTDMTKHFPSDLDSGLIQVINAPRDYYPDLNNLPRLDGDKPGRVQWRPKQSLDYSFLHYYCARLSKYYIQLEDDVYTDVKYFKPIKKYLDGRANQPWSTVEFGAQGFIGTTYRSEYLPSLAKFARFSFWTMPIDKIFRIYNDIHLHGNIKKDIFEPTIFKRVGN